MCAAGQNVGSLGQGILELMPCDQPEDVGPVEIQSCPHLPCGAGHLADRVREEELARAEHHQTWPEAAHLLRGRGPVHRQPIGRHRMKSEADGISLGDSQRIAAALGIDGDHQISGAGQTNHRREDGHVAGDRAHVDMARLEQVDRQLTRQLQDLAEVFAASVHIADPVSTPQVGGQQLAHQRARRGLGRDEVQAAGAPFMVLLDQTQ